MIVKLFESRWGYTNSPLEFGVWEAILDRFESIGCFYGVSCGNVDFSTAVVKDLG